MDKPRSPRGIRLPPRSSSTSVISRPGSKQPSPRGALRNSTGIPGGRSPTVGGLRSSQSHTVGALASPGSGGSSYSDDDILTLPEEGVSPFLIAFKEQLVRCAADRSPPCTDDEAIREVFGSTGQTVSKNWLAVAVTLTSSQCWQVVVHFLRKLRAPLITTQLHRWFSEAESVSEDKYQFQLFFSLVHSLPNGNRVNLECLGSMLAGSTPPPPGLGPALFGLAPNHFSGNVFVKKFLGVPACFTPSYLKLSLQENPPVISQCVRGALVNIIADPYYCSSLMDPSFDSLCALMHEYFWPSPDVVVLACGHAMRRFMRPEPWAVEARSRVIGFVKLFVDTLAYRDVQSSAFKKNWAWLVQLLEHAKNVGKEGGDVPASIREGSKHLVFYPFETHAKGMKRPVKSSVVPLDSLLAMDLDMVARVLLRFFLEPFVELEARDLCRCRFLKEEDSPTFAVLVNQFNGLQHLAIKLILEPEIAKERQVVVAFLIKCARRSVKLNNFNAAKALYFGLSDPAISRLAKTWKLVPAKLMGYMADLKALADPSNNHAVYATALKAATESGEPVVPYVGIISKYLFSMEDANPDEMEDKMLNVVKFRMVYKYVRSLLDLKKQAEGALKNSSMTSSETLLLRYFADACWNGAKEDSQALYDLSLEREPREQS